MIIIIPKGVKKVWDKWNIRSFILFSLFLQIFLLFTASLRKRTANKLVTFTIWSAYLLADWAASFAVGLVFDTEEKYTTSGPGIGKVDDTGLFLVLWAPFFLLLVGGQDKITSFAVEDNELWRRHLIWLVLQVFTTGFVFIQSLHQNRLWIPTLLLLAAGAIKYAERTAALYLASSDSFGISVLKVPNPGPNYERLMRTYSHHKNSNVPVQFTIFDDRESQVAKYDRLFGILSDSELMQHAYRFANMYKGLIVNLMFSSREHKESRDFFCTITPRETLRILEIELNYFYDLLHTKAVVANSNGGKIARYSSFGLVVAALSLFHKEDKHGFQSFDVKVTYTLFYGVLGLDMITNFLWVFSYWTVAFLKVSANPSKIFDKLVDKIRKTRWKQSEMVTEIISRRWSETLLLFNFIEYCCKESGSETESNFRIMITKMLKYMHIKDFIEHKINEHIQKRYMVRQPLPEMLWEFIFTELLEKSYYVDDIKEAKRILSARGDWVLENGDFMDGFDSSKLMPYVENVAYDESLLLWHIATELCYEDEECKKNDERRNLCCDYWHARKFSKYLSGYMIYLLCQQPSLMSEVSGIAKQRVRDTLAEAQRFFRQSADANYASLLKVDTPLKPVYVKGNLSKSVLFDAIMLAKEIDRLGPEKWKVTSKVWVELMSYAASRSRGNAHVQQLSKGGELLTFVWLLMAHFGLRESWVETRIRTRLNVNK